MGNATDDFYYKATTLSYLAGVGGGENILLNNFKTQRAIDMKLSDNKSKLIRHNLIEIRGIKI